MQTLPLVTVNEINVLDPSTLKVSERNSYYLAGDIVWCVDAIGNRHAQVKAIFDTALNQGAADKEGIVPVNLDVRVECLHAITEKARYTTGGIYSMTLLTSFANNCPT